MAPEFLEVTSFFRVGNWGEEEHSLNEVPTFYTQYATCRQKLLNMQKKNRVNAQEKNNGNKPTDDPNIIVGSQGF